MTVWAWFPGVSKTHPAQDECFQSFHSLGFAGMMMVVTGEMKQSMNDQMDRVRFEGFTGLPGLPLHGLVGENDVAAQHGGWWLECQDIGGFVFAPEAGIEMLDMPVIGKNEGRTGNTFRKDMAMTLGHPTGTLDKLRHVPQCCPPAWIRNQDLSVRNGRAFHGESGRSGDDQVPHQWPADRKLRQYGRQGGGGQHRRP